MMPTSEDLAWAVVSMARDGGMPDTFWLTDSRIAMACEVLGLGPDQVRYLTAIDQPAILTP
jgi:hypothetical protein